MDNPLNIQNRGLVYENIHRLLKEAPKIARSDIEDIQTRLRELRTIFELDQTMSLPIISAARLITENNIYRIKYRKELLLQFIDENYLQLTNKTNNKQQLLDLMIQYPRILMQPTSIVFARLPFLIKQLQNKETNNNNQNNNIKLTFQQFNQLTVINTKTFLEDLKQFNIIDENIDEIYINYLKEEMNKLTIKHQIARKHEKIEVNSVMEVATSGTYEGNLCGILNEICDNIST